jgi:hypothetical protein
MVDLKMIVRFEVDACLSTDTTDSKRSVKKAPVLAVDDLADALESINISSSATSSTSEPSSSSPASVDIIRGGTQVLQDALLELTSRSVYFVDQLDWNDLYPQLVLSQTPAVRLGVHERGTFKELREWQVIGGADAGTSTSTGTGADADADSGLGSGSPPDLTAQRRETAAHMVRLARVLEDVQELAISRGPGPAGCFSLVCERGQMHVYGRKDAKSCLPSDVKARFSSAGAGAGADV